MLILTRKLGESITIGDDIKVTVLGVYGRQVRLGVEAPLKVIVHREEVYLKIKEENRKAARTIKGDLLGLARIIKGKIKGGDTKPDEPNDGVEYKSAPPRSQKDAARPPSYRLEWRRQMTWFRRKSSDPAKGQDDPRIDYARRVHDRPGQHEVSGSGRDEHAVGQPDAADSDFCYEEEPGR